MTENHEDVEAPAKLPYAPPSLVVLGTVQELTRSGLAGNPDGIGGDENGGS